MNTFTVVIVTPDNGDTVAYVNGSQFATKLTGVAQFNAICELKERVRVAGEEGRVTDRTITDCGNVMIVCYTITK